LHGDCNGETIFVYWQLMCVALVVNCTKQTTGVPEGWWVSELTVQWLLRSKEMVMFCRTTVVYLMTK
jgi:hypothetical protein